MTSPGDPSGAYRELLRLPCTFSHLHTNTISSRSKTLPLVRWPKHHNSFRVRFSANGWRTVLRQRPGKSRGPREEQSSMEASCKIERVATLLEARLVGAERGICAGCEPHHWASASGATILLLRANRVTIAPKREPIPWPHVFACA